MSDVDSFGELAGLADELTDDLAEARHTGSVVEVVKAEQELVGEFMETAAAAVADGDVSESDVPTLFEMIKEASENYNKGDLRTKFSDAMGEASEASDEREPFDDFLDRALDVVTIVKSTDVSDSATVYSWRFSDPDVDMVETKADAEGVTHLSWSTFRDRVYEAADGVDFAPPENTDVDAWRAWVQPLVEERSKTRESTGARTRAIERLEAEVAPSVGYLTPSDAVRSGGVYVEPEEGAVDDDAEGVVELDADDVVAVHIPNDIIEMVEDDSAASARAIQVEASARGYTAGTDGSVSRRFRVDGNRRRFWTFAPDFVMPHTVRATTHDPSSGAVGPAGATGGRSRSTGSTAVIGSDPDAETDGGAAEASDDTDEATGGSE